MKFNLLMCVVLVVPAPVSLLAQEGTGPDRVSPDQTGAVRGVTGDWKVTPEAVTATSQNNCIMAAIPGEVKGNYTLSFDFTRVSGEDTIAAILPVAGTQCVLELSGWGGRAHGIARVDKGSILRANNPTSVKPGTLENGKKYAVSVAVNVNGENADIRVQLDGRDLTRFQGEVKRLEAGIVIRLKDMNRVGLGIGRNNVVRFENVRRSSSSASAKPVADPSPGKPAVPSTPPAPRVTQPTKPATPDSAPIAPGAVDLTKVTLDPTNATLTVKTFQGEEVLHLKGNESVAFLTGAELADGVIECDIASETFSGLAFRGAGLENYDKVYLRPFNSGTAKHENTVQYASPGVPGGNWSALRSKFPGKYEAGADIRKSEWFHLKLEIQGETVRAFVNNAPEPVLVVDKMLGGRASGGIGIWGWDSYFKNFKFEPAGN